MEVLGLRMLKATFLKVARPLRSERRSDVLFGSTLFYRLNRPLLNSNKFFYLR